MNGWPVHGLQSWCFIKSTDDSYWECVSNAQQKSFYLLRCDICAFLQLSLSLFSPNHFTRLSSCISHFSFTLTAFCLSLCMPLYLLVLPCYKGIILIYCCVFLQTVFYFKFRCILPNVAKGTKGLSTNLKSSHTLDCHLTVDFN